MTATILHLVGNASVEGTGVARIIAGLAENNSRYQHAVCFLHGDGPLSVYLLQHGVASCEAIDLQNPWRSAWQLGRLLRQLKPAIVHQHAGGPRLSQLIRLLSPAKLVVHVHSTVNEATLRSGSVRLSSAVDVGIAISQAVAGAVNDARCLVIHTGVRVPPPALPGTRAGPNVLVGAAGRLVQVKGYEFLIRAFAKVAPLFPHARLQLCGDGPLREALQQEIQRLGCSHTIELALWCDDYPKQAQAWDIFVQPSIEEGLSISMLEAMAAGLPVIGSKTGGIPEVVIDGVTGLLVVPANVEALAAALRALLSDAALRTRLGAAARQRIVQHFSLDKMRSGIYRLYDSLLHEDISNMRLLRQRLALLTGMIPGLRSAWYLALELYEFVHHRRGDTRNELETLFHNQSDPWHYDSSPTEQRRLQRELQTITALCGPARIPRALEIGCAEGHFTALLADRCQSLTCLDFSPIALAHARQRRLWPDSVHFMQFDLYQDAIPGTFDLIVITCVIDYIENPFAIGKIRSQLVAALAPGGILLLGNSLTNEVRDKAWWSRVLLRGGYAIARYFAAHPQLEKIHECEMDHHLDTVFRKRSSGNDEVGKSH